jgi:hypothetical protein
MYNWYHIDVFLFGEALALEKARNHSGFESEFGITHGNTDKEGVHGIWTVQKSHRLNMGTQSEEHHNSLKVISNIIIYPNEIVQQKPEKNLH